MGCKGTFFLIMFVFTGSGSGGSLFHFVVVGGGGVDGVDRGF